MPDNSHPEKEQDRDSQDSQREVLEVSMDRQCARHIDADEHVAAVQYVETGETGGAPPTGARAALASTW